MDNTKKILLNAATDAAKRAYSPYSGFAVGAAVLGEDGNVYTGCNIENASYGLTVCGERVALFNMVNSGCKRFVALAVYCDGGATCMPCGACRQVMVEFAQHYNVNIYTKGNTDEVDFTLEQLLPHSFSGGFNEGI